MKGIYFSFLKNFPGVSYRTYFYILMTILTQMANLAGVWEKSLNSTLYQYSLLKLKFSFTKENGRMNMGKQL